MKKCTSIIFLLGGILLFSCKKPYEPEVIAAGNHFLVVEGILNNGDSTHIRLTRTRALDERYELTEQNAVVGIENESHQRSLLPEGKPGRYSGLISVNSAEKYRLYIKTTDGKEYFSDYVPVLETPPVDTITWKLEEKGLQTYVESHNSQNATRYYRWEYEEAWSTPPNPIKSSFKYENRVVVPRDPPTPSVCYGARTGSSILLGSTAKLSKDIVRGPINLIQYGAGQLADRYSILVKQYALEKGAYEYWLAMKKNTEQLGSITDPQPSYLYGNIHSSSDPKEIVIGFFGACNVPEKRIFITRGEAGWYKSPVDWDVDSTCIVKFVRLSPDPKENPAILAYYFGREPGQLGWVPLQEETNFWGQLLGYTAVKDLGCAECPQITPTDIKPVFWD